jgi:hypothetical protein
VILCKLVGMRKSRVIVCREMFLFDTCFLDSQVGDGTTTVVLLAGEFLREAKPFVEDGVHPQLIIRAFRIAADLVEF